MNIKELNTNWSLTKKAFTLIELLIVIAIIAILMTLLLPALRKAKESANKTVCKGNLKQTGLVQANYSSDFDGWFTPSYRHTWWPQLLFDCNYLIEPKAGQHSSLRCPSAKKGGDLWVSVVYTYGMNIRGKRSGDPYPAYKFKGPGFISDLISTNKTYWLNTPPSRFIFLADSYMNYPADSYLDGRQLYVVGWDTNYEISIRHNKRANILFGDNHVDDLNTNQIVELDWLYDGIFLNE